jgi:hypothetical protein
MISVGSYFAFNESLFLRHTRATEGCSLVDYSGQNIRVCVCVCVCALLKPVTNFSLDFWPSQQ